MSPTTTALVLEGVFALVAFGWRTFAQYRATGSTGLVVHRERGATAKAAGLLMVAGLLTLVVGTAVSDSRQWSLVAAVGVVAMLAALWITLAAQRSMGDAWRIGVDPAEHNELVTDGLFGQVRNPVFSGMLLFSIGIVLVVPNMVTICGLAAAVVGIVAQVLYVEEPHLRRQHGAAYDDYVRQAGRFLPRPRRRTAPA